MYVDSSGRLFVPAVSVDISEALRSIPTHEILNIVRNKMSEVRAEVDMVNSNLPLSGISVDNEGALPQGAKESLLSNILSYKGPSRKNPMLPTLVLSFEEKALLRDFLISCCEPACRTHHMNEYIITPSSLSAAAAEGMYSMDDVGCILQYYAFCHNGSSGGKETVYSPVPVPIQEMLRKQTSTSRLRLLLRRKIGSSTADVSYYLYSPSKGYLESIIIGGKIRHLFNCVAVEPGQPPQLILSDYEVGLGVSSKTSLLSSSVKQSGGQREPGMAAQANSEYYENMENPKGSYISQPLVPKEKDFETIRNYLINRRAYRLDDAATKSSTNTRPNATAVPMVYCAEVKPNRLRDLKRCLSENYGINVDCYYDFQSDTDAKNVLNFTLKDDVKLRPYQEASLERFCQAIGANSDESGSVIAAIQSTRSRDQDNFEGKKGNLQQRTDIIKNKRFIAHHGVVVLPCGAGKTLTGISASAMVGKRTLVLCVNVLSVLQWRDQFLKWTHLKPSQITICTKDVKDIPGDIFITTYTMLTVDRNTAAMTAQSTKKRKEIFDEIESTTWGMLLLDEVHMAPANHFQTVVDKVKHKCILGLTATLLREDLKVEDLRFLVGPKLYEANWLELTQAGHLASVTCAEIRCPLPPELLKEYLTVSRINEKNISVENSAVADNKTNGRGTLAGGKRGRKNDDNEDDPGDFHGLLASKMNQRFDTKENQEKKGRAILTDIECINPYKLWCTQALIAFHESRSPPDKIIVFCDSCPAARYYAHKLGLPFMYGITSSEERSNILKHFVHSKTLHTIILSRVGDIALDLPEATVIIQVSGLFSSKRQEAQRLGRILRPKPPSLDHGTSFFYSLVSQDTDEVKHLSNRQIWLRNQGYSYLSLSYHCVMKEYDKLRQRALVSYRRSESLKETRGGLLPWGRCAIGKRKKTSIGSLPLLRPLVCIGPPVWYFVIPVIQSFVEIFHINDKNKPSSQTGDHVPLSIRALSTSMGSQWVSFSPANAIELERRFLGGYHRYLTVPQRMKYESKISLTKENNKDQQFSPLYLPEREILPLYVDIHVIVKDDTLSNTINDELPCHRSISRLTAAELGPLLCTILFDAHGIPESNGRLSFKPEPHKQMGKPLLPPKNAISLPILLSSLLPSKLQCSDDSLSESERLIIDTITKGVRDCYETEYSRVVQGGCIGNSSARPGFGSSHSTSAVEASAPFSIKRGHIMFGDGSPDRKHVSNCSSSLPYMSPKGTSVLCNEHRCVDDVFDENAVDECGNPSLVSSDCILYLMGVLGKR